MTRKALLTAALLLGQGLAATEADAGGYCYPGGYVRPCTSWPCPWPGYWPPYPYGGYGGSFGSPIVYSGYGHNYGYGGYGYGAYGYGGYGQGYHPFAAYYRSW